MGKIDPLSMLDSGGNAAMPDFEKLKARTPKNLSNAVTDETVQVYKWRDKNGVMQFSNIPPADGSSAEQVVLQPNHNVVPAVKIPERETVAAEVSSETPNPYSIKGMKKVMEDAKGVEQLLQDRHEQQQKMLNNL